MRCIAIIGILTLLASCNYEAEVPTYLYIEPFELTTDPITEGTDSELITDAWVYLNDESVGVFELPAKVPVVSSEGGELLIVPGIKVNGISGSRGSNPFYNPVALDFEPAPATVDTIYPSTTYRDNAVFPLLENFESGNDFTDISRISTSSEVFEGNYCGVVRLDPSNNNFAAASFKYELPQDGSKIYLEMNYRNSAKFNVSIVAYPTPTDTKVEYALTITPKEQWNKIYVDLTEEVNANKALNYQLVFSGNLPDGATDANFYFDNIKIVHL